MIQKLILGIFFSLVIIFLGIISPMPAIPKIETPSKTESETREVFLSELKSKFTTATSTKSTATKTKPIIKIPTISPTPPKVSNNPLVEVPPAPVILIASETINQSLRKALVNIFCTTKSGGLFKPITASGVIIDPRGVILTNAHVAQYFLLKDYGSPDFLSCDIRVGSPAKSAYKARLLYIPGEWIEANASALRESVSLGTGEHDWALLLITAPTGINSTLPSFFDYLSPKTNFKRAILNQPVVLGGYPSEFLGGIATAKDLYAVTSLATIKNTYFFQDANSNEIDIFSVGGNIISQGGSSGGAVVDQMDGKLTGLVVTSTQADTTDEKILRATTLDYVSRDLKKLTGETLETLFAKNLSAEIELFAQTDFIRLKRILEKVLSPN